MSLLTYLDLQDLINTGVVEGADPSRVNGSSLDITLGNEILKEMEPEDKPHQLVQLNKRDTLTMRTVTLKPDFVSDFFILQPGEFILAHSREIFHLPLNISCEFKLKSSLARIGINQLTACWCDPGWNNSVMTLELQNTTRYHSIVLRPGDPIGQVVFIRHAAVPANHSYAKRGRYNNDKTVSGIKP